MIDSPRRPADRVVTRLDAIHLASAIAVGADSVLTYDDRLAESAAALGLDVLALAG